MKKPALAVFAAIGLGVTGIVGYLFVATPSTVAETAAPANSGAIELAQAVPKPPAVPARPAPAAAPAPAPAAAAQAPAPGVFSAKLREAGIKNCLATVDGLAARTMDGVTGYSPASNWNVTAPDQHLTSVLLGQRFANAPNLPYGLSGIISAPNGKGKCDGVSLQVLPSPLPCKDLSASIAKGGKLLGDLSGVALLQDGNNNQVALIPTAANTCVMVAIRLEYADK